MTARVLLVDLNNFARYPSIAIGYLAAVLRSHDFEVKVLAPFSTGLEGVPREPTPPWWGRLDLEFRYRTGVTRNRFVKWIRSRYAARRASQLARSKKAIVSDFTRQLDSGFDLVLVSTYLMYHPHCVAMGEICRDRSIPMILGGPYFAAEDVAREWIDTPGVAALVGGEVEPYLGDIVSRTIRGEPVDHIKGVWRSNGALTLDAPPLLDLDSVPFPDYRDFPLSKYPNNIIPVVTGRGCGWGVCLFCSDVTSTAGRTFRSRSPANVLDEIAHQNALHGTRLFVFTDPKLNSNMDMWRAIIREIQKVVPDARWIGAVHVGTHGDNGLTLNELQQARAAGMVRLTTGLESGSQRVLDRMVKGTEVEATSQFLFDARDSDISVRTTMIIGYPGEEAVDVDQTAEFLAKHESCIERISLNRFQIMSGTQFANQIERKPQSFPTITDLEYDHRRSEIHHYNTKTKDRSYRLAISRLLRIVHRINRKPLSAAALDFEGVM